MCRGKGVSLIITYLICIISSGLVGVFAQNPELGSVRVVFQADYSTIPDLGKKKYSNGTGRSRLRCPSCFVAQVADVAGGRSAPMNEEQREEADKTVVGEFSDVKHVRGILSMGRYSDPNSAGSSFSILLGDAPHLDGEYAIFGKITKGDDTLKKLEQLPTRREGIFLMPTERITILSSYYYDSKTETCEQEKSILRRRVAASAVEIEIQRMKCFP